MWENDDGGSKTVAKKTTEKQPILRVNEFQLKFLEGAKQLKTGKKRLYCFL